MRSIAAFPERIPVPISKKVENEYTFRTITPVFGAGVETGVLDEQTPVRGTTVRGHLRFWWRATRGRAFTDYAELRARESAIWGDTDTPSEVDVEVRVNPNAEAKAASEFVEDNPGLGYVLFPFTEMSRGTVPGAYWKELTFHVRVWYPQEMEKEVKAALWAWANFGGIGARTRRGCGALFCKDFAPPDPRTTRAWTNNALSAYLDDAGLCQPGPHEWASIEDGPLVNRASGKPVTAEEAWKKAVQTLAEYRQLPPHGRKGTPGKPYTYSRSYWPEADSLRAITGAGIPDHMNCLTATKAFPRAELGLPYLMKFKSKTGSTRDEVNNCTIFPLESGRKSSPVILRPIAFGDGKSALPAILPISAGSVSGVRIEFGRSTTELRGPAYVTDPRLAEYDNSPMGPKAKPLSAKGSALEGFLAFAKTKGFQF